MPSSFILYSNVCFVFSIYVMFPSRLSLDFFLFIFLLFNYILFRVFLYCRFIGNRMRVYITSALFGDVPWKERPRAMATDRLLTWVNHASIHVRDTSVQVILWVYMMLWGSSTTGWGSNVQPELKVYLLSRARVNQILNLCRAWPYRHLSCDWRRQTLFSSLS